MVLPGDFASQVANAALAFRLEQESQRILDDRFLCRRAAGSYRLSNQTVVDFDLDSHAPPTCSSDRR